MSGKELTRQIPSLRFIQLVKLRPALRQIRIDGWQRCRSTRHPLPRLVPAPIPLAAQWYAKAADQGLADAQNSLGVCYASGTGVPENHTLAVQWYSKAAEQGHAAAQYNLGSSYEHGWGVPQDAVDAMKWYLISSAQGYQIASGQIKSLSPSLNAEQRAQAEVRAEAFQKTVKK